MAGFSPHKKHARSFNYTPRYYDPLKEEFEKRREELRGERRDTTSTKASTEYTPGQYIRTKRMAREEKKREATQHGKRKTWISMAIVAIFILLGYIILPKFIAIFGYVTSSSPKQEVVVESEEWNPYRPIEVVPNDYVEE